VMAERAATLGHCPYKYAKMAMTLQSFQRYLDAGVTISLGTDTFPLDIVSELRWASILAKTARDAMMNEYDAQFPGYGFASHKGYATAAHRDAIRHLGPCAIHRRSFTLLPHPTLWEW